jgi:hypothetical protein
MMGEAERFSWAWGGVSYDETWELEYLYSKTGGNV